MVFPTAFVGDAFCKITEFVVPVHGLVSPPKQGLSFTLFLGALKAA
jgi:hypothetical protein